MQNSKYDARNTKQKLYILKKEQALFLLGLLYRETKNSENMKKVWNEYLKNYPEGTYTSIINSFLKGGEEK